MEARIIALRSFGPQHTQMGEKMLTAHDGDLFPMDLLGAAVLNRSMRLIKGFSALIPNNFVSAAPLVRLQLDNLLRFHAAFLVTDPHGFVIQVLGGTPINKLTSFEGTKLTDAFLVGKLSSKYPDIKSFYERGCSYVHLSDLHILHAVQSGGERAISITISEEEPEVTDELRLDAVETMIVITERLLNHISGWIHTKAKPELVPDPLERAHTLVQSSKLSEARQLLESVIADHPNPAMVADAKQVLVNLGAQAPSSAP
jgi:hypothetical protein